MYRRRYVSNGNADGKYYHLHRRSSKESRDKTSVTSLVRAKRVPLGKAPLELGRCRMSDLILLPRFEKLSVLLIIAPQPGQGSLLCRDTVASMPMEE